MTVAKGDTFGFYRVTSDVYGRRTPAGKMARVADVVCKCGKRFTLEARKLLKGHSKGCQRCRGNETKKRNMVSDKEYCVKYVFWDYRKTARRRGIDFDLTADQIADFVFAPCFYCGDEPSNKAKVKGRGRLPDYNGMDRVNNDIGYRVDNIVTCCRKCNECKQAMTLEDFLTWIDKIAARKQTILSQLA